MALSAPVMSSKKEILSSKKELFSLFETSSYFKHNLYSKAVYLFHLPCSLTFSRRFIFLTCSRTSIRTLMIAISMSAKMARIRISSVFRPFIM